MTSDPETRRAGKSALPPEASDFDAERAEPVGRVLRRWAMHSGVLRLSDRERIWDAWQRLLGPDAAHTSLEGLRNRGPSAGVASFVVDSSALLQDLKSFRKQELLEGLRRDVRTYFIQDLKFRLEKKSPPKPARR